MTNDNILGNQSLEYLLTISEKGSISAAANALFISQPALSKYVKNLELRYGFKIFNRIGNKLTLTLEGQKILEYGTKIQSLEKSLTREIEDIKNNVYGRIRLGLPVYWLPIMVPPIIIEYKKKCPTIDVDIIGFESATKDSLLLDGRVDYTLSRSASYAFGVESTLIRHDRILLVTSPEIGNMLFKGYQPNSSTDFKQLKKIDVSALSNLPFVLPNYGQPIRKKADKMFNDYHIKPNIKLECINNEANVKLATENIACCFSSEQFLRNMYFPKPFCVFEVDYDDFNLTVHLCKNESSIQTSYMKTFEEMIFELYDY